MDQTITNESDKPSPACVGDKARSNLSETIDGPCTAKNPKFLAVAAIIDTVEPKSSMSF